MTNIFLLLTTGLESATNPKLRTEKFLERIDKLAEKRGLNSPQIVKLEELQNLPQGSFGRAWADFIHRHNLAAFTTGPRRKQLHDGIHVLTGYSTDALGEAEVQAFILATKPKPLNLILGLGLMRLAKKELDKTQQRSRQLIFQRVYQAYQRGCKSSFDPDTWQPENLWELPLTEVQTSFGLIAT